MTAPVITGPIVDAEQAKRKRSPDWLVIVKRGSLVDAHRFTSRERADAFVDEVTS